MYRLDRTVDPVAFHGDEQLYTVKIKESLLVIVRGGVEYTMSLCESNQTDFVHLSPSNSHMQFMPGLPLMRVYSRYSPTEVGYYYYPVVR